MRDKYSISELNPRKNHYITEAEQRFAAINAREPEIPTDEEAASFARAEAMDDGTLVDLEDLKVKLSL